MTNTLSLVPESSSMANRDDNVVRLNVRPIQFRGDAISRITWPKSTHDVQQHGHTEDRTDRYLCRASGNLPVQNGDGCRAEYAASPQ